MSYERQRERKRRKEERKRKNERERETVDGNRRRDGETGIRRWRLREEMVEKRVRERDRNRGIDA